MIVMLVIGLYMTFVDFRDNPILTTFNIIQVRSIYFESYLLFT